MPALDITNTERGFHCYGEAVTDLNGGTFYVVESSLATEPAVRVYVDASSWQWEAEPGRASLHLNEEQARALAARLEAWLREVCPNGGGEKRLLMAANEPQPLRSSLYRGWCSACQQEARARVVQIGPAKAISPPHLHCACTCQLPVVPLVLTYCGLEDSDDEG